VVTRRRARGFSMFEAAVSVVVLTVIAASVAMTGSSEIRHFARSHEETVAGRAAASRLETLAASRDPLAPGTTAFDLGDAAASLKSGAARQTVTQEEPGLFRVETEVTWRAADGTDARVVLATLVAREVRR
jgi:Tfp pilus assembly protein PilV